MGLNGDNYHFGYVSGSMGYSMLQMSTSSAVSKGALGGSLGVGYEFRNSGFWTSVGVQISMHRSTLIVPAPASAPGRGGRSAPPGPDPPPRWSPW